MAKLWKVTGEKSSARTNDMHGCKLQNFNIAARIVFKFHAETHQNLCRATRLNIQSQSQYIYTMSTRPFFNGIIFLTILYATAFVGTIVVMGPTLFLLRLQPRWFRWINDRLTVIREFSHVIFPREIEPNNYHIKTFRSFSLIYCILLQFKFTYL